MLADPKSQLYYPFQNTLLDGSGHGRDGTLGGSPACSFVAGGPRGRALYFPGTGYVVTPSFGLSGTVVVFAAWGRCKFSATIRQVLSSDSKWSTYPCPPYFLIGRTNNTNTLVFEYSDAGTARGLDLADFFSAPYNDTWFHFCLVADYTGKKVYAYRAGTLISTLTMLGTPGFPSANCVKYLGSHNTTMFMLTAGYMADVYLGTLATCPPQAVLDWNAKRLAMGLHPIW